MKNRLSIILSFSLLFMSFQNLAQSNIKYKDVFEILINEGDEAAYPILKQHQQQDPYHVNTYYQLGVIAQKWAKKYDPLTEYDYVKYFVYHANLYLKMTEKYLDDKEARKNREYYHIVEFPEEQKKLQLEDIQKDIHERIAQVDTFNRKINTIRKNYYSCVNNYNACLELFFDINTQNSKLKDIYLIAGDTLMEKIELLSNRFDSVMYYFDQYKKAIHEYPIKGYNQNYTLAPIETYKLHGLTNSNFLKNDIQIWNYGAWVDQVTKVINDDIKKLRSDIRRTGKELESLISVLNLTRDYSRNYDSYELDKSLVYRIGKFDYDPLILDLFNYQTTKIDFLIKDKDPDNNPEDTLEIPLFQRLKFMHDFVDQKFEIDAKTQKLKNNAIPYNVMKYQEYIADNYSDLEGLLSYAEHERIENQEIIDESFGVIKTHVVKENMVNQDVLNFIEYKNANIPLFITPVSFINIRPDQYYTNQIINDADGNIYLSGFVSSDEKNTEAFIALSDSTKQILWIKTFDFSSGEHPDLYHSCSLLALTEEGCMAVVNATDEREDSTYIENRLLRFDYKGNEIMNEKIGPPLIPRFLYFDDLNEKMLIAYKGSIVENKATELQDLVIDYADSTGYTLWSTSMELAGNIVDVIRSNENFILVSNFSKVIANDKVIEVKSQNRGLTTNAFSAVLDNSGGIENIEVYTSGKSYFVSNVVKINSEIINLLGFESNVQDYSYVQSPEVKLVYKLIETSGEEIYSY